MSAEMILVYDGLCKLCSANARFVMRHDRNGRVRLVSLYSEEGRALYGRFGLDADDPETLIVIQRGAMLRDSAAVLEIWRTLGWPWSLGRLLSVIPATLRDPVYRFVARHRYRLFGRRQTCWLPENDSR